jgi:hypothetical protein
MKLEYSTMYLEALKEIKSAHDALVKRDFQSAYEHSMNAQAEIKLMSNAVRTWIPTEETP